MMAPSTSQATKALDKLSLETPFASTTSTSKTRSQPKAKKIADSWEDEESSEDEVTTPVQQNSKAGGVAAPPPTPISPSYGRHGPDDNTNDAPWLARSTSDGGSYLYHDENIKRPEKTDAVARRMIASALGVRAPKATEEQKAYDRAVREQERKKREEEKAAERKRKDDADKAKAAMWND
ncbi:hypothetical protein GGR57DRAFT_197473 [Xylariaceae sp. FL1272]|nr:hypothetical protein GGR57DRAFT_197473 [Xylariaceae sp. FL1272]